jgi:hypothetical protein
LGIATDDWSPSTPAHFPNQAARYEFLRAVAMTADSAWLAEPMPGDDRGALVRWRPGGFLRLNDLAYAHGGRIVVNVPIHLA